MAFANCPHMIKIYIKKNLFLYPTGASKANSGNCMANAIFYLAHEIQTSADFADIKKEILEIDNTEASKGVTLLPINEEKNHIIKNHG